MPQFRSLRGHRRSWLGGDVIARWRRWHSRSASSPCWQACCGSGSANSISEPVLKDFIIGLALTIIIGQVPKLLGIEKGAGDLAIGILAGYAFRLQDHWVKIVGHITAGLPAFGFPKVPAADFLKLSSGMVVNGSLSKTELTASGAAPEHYRTVRDAVSSLSGPPATHIRGTS